MGQLAKHDIDFFLDEEGYLKNLTDWDEDIARQIAKREGLEELSESKLEIVRFLRDYYQKFDSFPILNYVCKNIHQPRECVNDEFIDPMKAWKIAGLPKVDNIYFHSYDGKHYFANPYD